MPIVPFRALGQSGIITDPNPDSLDNTAWSNGSNVRFASKKAMRAPAFRTVYDNLPFDPIFGAPYRPPEGLDGVVLPDTTGRIWLYKDLTITEVTPTGITQVVVINGGSGYTAPPTVTFSAAAGQTAAAGTAVIAAGAVTGITITSPGVYPVGSPAPTVTIAAPPSGTAAMATTPDPYVPESTAMPYTAAWMADVLYINNPAGQPVYFGPRSTTFAAMASWSPTWSCQALRPYGDYLIALNVTKGGVVYPNMVKTSDLTLAGQPPGSWNQNDQTTLATENILEQLDSPLIDGMGLRDSFILYTTDQVWIMSQTGNQEVFAYDKVFSDGGVINQNCVVEVMGSHFVFGPYDIYRHDGVNKTSICNTRVQDFIFQSMNTSYSNFFFAVHNPALSEVMFCYTSGDANAAFVTTSGCNKGAVYNYVLDTWSFIDLPNVVAFGQAGLNSAVLWNSVLCNNSWAQFGGSWYSESDPRTLDNWAVSRSLTGSIAAPRLLNYSFINKAAPPFPLDLTEVNPPAFIERTGIDLDQMNGDQPSGLALYKVVKRVFPQVAIFGGQPLQISIGSQLTPSAPVNYAPPITFDPTQQYKVDIRKGGRYLAIRFSQPALADFEVSGFDADVVSAGVR